MSSWIRDNSFIVAALALPVVVVVFFLAATTIPQWVVDDPRYDLLFTLEHYDNGQPGDIVMYYRVTDGRLHANAHLVVDVRGFSSQQLFRFNAKTLAVERVEPTIPQHIRAELANRAQAQASDPQNRLPSPPLPPLPPKEFPGASFVVAEFEGNTIQDTTAAPDGYEFSSNYGSSRGLFGEIFGIGGRSSQALRIEKDGRAIRLQTPQAPHRHYYHQSAHLGWIIP